MVHLLNMVIFQFIMLVITRWYIYMYIIYTFWVNYSDLTVLPHWKSWLVKENIPK